MWAFQRRETTYTFLILVLIIYITVAIEINNYEWLTCYTSTKPLLEYHHIHKCTYIHVRCIANIISMIDASCFIVARHLVSGKDNKQFWEHISFDSAVVSVI